tara:strand:+ start:135 stop:1178 length:1044 start_codon:yes stop_codon:yes gene_type:complete
MPPVTNTGMLGFLSGGGGGGGVSDSFFEILGRTTLTGNATSISLDSFTAKNNLMILGDLKSTAEINLTYSTGTDSYSGNYADRRQENGGSDETTVNRTDNGIITDLNTKSIFTVGLMENTNSQKQVIWQAIGGNETGADNAPDKFECVGKFTGSSPVNRMRFNSNGNNFLTSSEILVLGYDNDQSSGNSFTELANVTLGSAGDNIDTGASGFTAKKYLYVQISCLETGGNINGNITFNDTANQEYCRRRNNDFSGDNTATEEDSIDVLGDEQMSRFIELWILNRDDQEKLVIGNIVRNGASGAGNAPQSCMFSSKWANNAQVTRIECDNTGAGSYDTGSSIKVWGFD